HLEYQHSFGLFLKYAKCYPFGFCRLPPPTELSHKWLDPFTVNVYWRKPSQLPDCCDVQYRHGPHNVGDTLLTDEAGSSGWNITVRTEELQNCGKSASAPASIIIDAPQPRAQLVTDFKCLYRADKTNCSWIPCDPAVNLTLSYRICGRSAESRQQLQECKQSYHHPGRHGCYLSADFVSKDVCMLLRSNASMRTFKLQGAVDPPKLHVSVEGDKLNLSWTPPEVSNDCSWTYTLCYSKCDEREVLLIESLTLSCTTMIFFSAVVVNEPRVSVTAMAIAVSLVLSVGVLLACYCFRRHRAVLFPAIPDPSAILKDMMMSGSTEIKASANFYTPVPEAIQPCKIMRPLLSLQLNYMTVCLCI
uniref:Interleukin-13 receptor subunit alpha-1-like n=1 Tax=Hippocampus comes TaxID=109280 RepID=A0A3Q2XU48_HIPCM